MKAPDKIYIPRDLDLVSAAILTKGGQDGDVEYIHKDAMLKWAKELKEQVCSLHPKNRDATCARDGMLTIIDNIFDKLNNF